MSLLEFYRRHTGELFLLLRQHLGLVMISTAVALVVGLPLGVLVARRPAWRRPILGVTNVVQTVPSLALFGLLIPLLGIGAWTAITALVLYALLPIVRNTYAGIASVDPAVREAGRGMGMSDGELLRIVELPLAAAVILAGVRVAVVVSVGIATIAAAIGAGGLGVYIFRGVATVDDTLILAGAVPAALLALLADGLLGVAERRLVWRPR
ncbi:MAG TPA: ABC transporter permease [Gemmatimonadales bacterium]|nr:ABC transporter permease [Gemmatimonadales bacterium]